MANAVLHNNNTQRRKSTPSKALRGAPDGLFSSLGRRLPRRNKS
jgi:hypothetical protein